MYKKILVPLDGSERAEKILPHVMDYAVRNESALIFLQVIEPGVIDTNPFDAYPEVTAKAARAHAKEVSDYLRGCEEKFQAEGIDTQRGSCAGPS